MRTVHSRVDGPALQMRSGQWLGYAGLIPFWVLPAVQIASSSLTGEVIAEIERWIMLYGAIIVSFMGGVRWAFRVVDVDEQPGALFGGFLGAVTPALVAWMIAALPAELMGREIGVWSRLWVILFLLGFQLVQDWSHKRQGGPIPSWFFDLRIVLVVGATGAIFLGWLLSRLLT